MRAGKLEEVEQKQTKETKLESPSENASRANPPERKIILRFLRLLVCEFRMAGGRTGGEFQNGEVDGADSVKPAMEEEPGSVGVLLAGTICPLANASKEADFLNRSPQREQRTEKAQLRCLCFLLKPPVWKSGTTGLNHGWPSAAKPQPNEFNRKDHSAASPMRCRAWAMPSTKGRRSYVLG